jgi:hypothetical protein
MKYNIISLEKEIELHTTTSASKNNLSDYTTIVLYCVIGHPTLWLVISIGGGNG